MRIKINEYKANNVLFTVLTLHTQRIKKISFSFMSRLKMVAFNCKHFPHTSILL